MLTLVYKNLIQNKSVKEIHQEIASIINKNKVPELGNYIDRLTVKAKKKTVGKKPDEIALIVWLFFEKEKVYSKTNSILFENNKKYEADLKEKIFKDNPSVFYLASEHEDSAKDHAPYQGKIYVDENWDRNNRELANYIQKNGIRTFQWVINGPVWFITRPNCRHYFKKLTVNEVLTTPVNVLIRKYNMHSKIGRRRYQTIREADGESTYYRYKDRLKYHESLYKVFKLDKIKKAIDKDRLMVNKWQKYLTK